MRASRWEVEMAAGIAPEIFDLVVDGPRNVSPRRWKVDVLLDGDISS